jgi:hypothetical protein
MPQGTLVHKSRPKGLGGRSYGPHYGSGRFHHGDTENHGGCTESGSELRQLIQVFVFNSTPTELVEGVLLTTDSFPIKEQSVRACSVVLRVSVVNKSSDSVGHWSYGTCIRPKENASKRRRFSS